MIIKYHQPPAKFAGVGPASSTGNDCRDEDHLRKKGVLEIRVRLGRYLSNHMKPTWQENTHIVCVHGSQSAEVLAFV